MGPGAEFTQLDSPSSPVSRWPASGPPLPKGSSRGDPDRRVLKVLPDPERGHSESDARYSRVGKLFSARSQRPDHRGPEQLGPRPNTRRRIPRAHPGRRAPATPHHATLRNGTTTPPRRTHRLVPLRSRKPDAGNLHVRVEVGEEPERTSLGPSGPHSAPAERAILELPVPSVS